MKKSFYNFEFPFQEGSSQTIFYNSRTNALALLEAENYTQYKAFCEDGAAITDEKFLEGLIGTTRLTYSIKAPCTSSVIVDLRRLSFS